MICRHFKSFIQAPFWLAEKEPSGGGKNCSSWNGHLRRALKALPKYAKPQSRTFCAVVYIFSLLQSLLSS